VAHAAVSIYGSIAQHRGITSESAQLIETEILNFLRANFARLHDRPQAAVTGTSMNQTGRPKAQIFIIP
jgi:hypothetical protein